MSAISATEGTHQRKCENAPNKRFSFSFRYKTYSILRGHILTDHVKAYEQVCDICAKVFKTKQNFKDHMMTHTNESRIQCSHCGTWLKNKLVLRKHIRLHKAKPKTCQICQCVKPNQAALSSHMRAVHGEAKNKCTFCDKAFIKKIALRVGNTFD